MNLSALAAPGLAGVAAVQPPPARGTVVRSVEPSAKSSGDTARSGVFQREESPVVQLVRRSAEAYSLILSEANAPADAPAPDPPDKQSDVDLLA